MALFSDRDKFQIYRYRVKEFFILLGDEVIHVDKEQIQTILILDDFVLNLFPILRVQLALTEATYYKIMKNSEQVKFKIYLQSYYLKEKRNTSSVYAKTFNEVFTLLNDEDPEFLSEDINKKEFPNTDENSLNAVTTMAEFYLTEADLYKRSKKSVMYNLKKCKASTAFRLLFTKLGIKNLLMYRFDKTVDKEQQIFIPSMRIPDAIQWLDTYYGSYKKGSTIYFGFDRSYMLPFGGTSKVFEPDEKQFVSIVIPKIGGQYLDHICQVDKYGDDNKYYVVADPNSFEPSPDKRMSATNEDDVSTIDPGTGEVEGNDDGSTKYVTKFGFNPYLSDIYRAQRETTSVEVLLKDVDINILTVNKIYQFLFEDTKLNKKYKGRYYLKKRSILISKESKAYTAAVNCTFAPFVNLD